MRLTHLTLGLALTASLVALAACENVSHYVYGTLAGAAQGGQGQGGQGQGAASSVTRRAALTDIAACAVELYTDFEVATLDLADATAALEAAPSDQALALAAQAEWRRTIGLWQQAEPLMVGPAGPAALPGGQSLRDEIYSWPLVSRCLVEGTLVTQGYAAPDFGATSLVNVRGLAAAEYLLFYAAGDNGCSATNTINSSGSWAALSPAELASRKAAYASVVSSALTLRADQVLEGWTSSFSSTLANAPTEGGFTSDQMALNALSDGLFYLDHQTKDDKLGRPLGLIDCTTATCPEALESRFAGTSKTHIRNNLVGFRRLFAGCASHPVAFDDLLVAMGAGELATRVVADVDAAIAVADALSDDSLAVALANDKASVTALHAAIKKVTDALKTEIVTVLDLEIPKVVEGDND